MTPLSDAIRIRTGERGQTATRVSADEEMDGLDVNEHGNEAYSDDVVQRPSSDHA